MVDVYLGEERTRVQLPAKLARGLASLFLQAPARRTKHTPADDALWQSTDLDGWWGEIVKSETVSGGRNQTYHMTESLSLPEIGIGRFNAFKEWVKEKAAAKLARAGRDTRSEEEVDKGSDTENE